MSTQSYPVVQFSSLADWMIDLDGSYVIGVWHALQNRPGFVKRSHTIVRAIVADEGMGRIAALAFEHVLLFVEPGRPAGDEAQARHAAEQHDVLIDHIRTCLTEIGYLASMFRVGAVDLPGDPALVYAKHPLDEMAEELAAALGESA